MGNGMWVRGEEPARVLVHSVVVSITSHDGRRSGAAEVLIRDVRRRLVARLFEITTMEFLRFKITEPAGRPYQPLPSAGPVCFPILESGGRSVVEMGNSIPIIRTLRRHSFA